MKCFDNGACIAQSGQDQLGMPKVAGWTYMYSPANNTVNYWNPEAKGVPHKGQPARYIATIFVVIEKLARPKEHVPPLTAVGTWLMLAPAAIASEKIFQDKLFRHLFVQKSGLQGLWWSSQVFVLTYYRLPRFDPCHLPSRQIKGRLVKDCG